MAAVQMNRTHRILISVVVLGAVVIAAIGFAGSYAAVRDLAEKKGFGDFAVFFPIGIDAGIVVLLALDLLLTWIRIPFPLLRQTAWLLTAATIAFNGAAAWPDPLGVAMHGIIPVLFVVAVEAARHAIGRVADITADKYMEGVRVSRWLLAFPSTFRLWRRMKLWELRSYEEVIRLEQDRMVYRARLRARYGRAWRRKAPVEAVMPLKLARYGVPLAETAQAGLAAAGIDAPLWPQTELTQRRSEFREYTERAGEGLPAGQHGAAVRTPAGASVTVQTAAALVERTTVDVEAAPARAAVNGHTRPAPQQPSHTAPPRDSGTQRAASHVAARTSSPEAERLPQFADFAPGPATATVTDAAATRSTVNGYDQQRHAIPSPRTPEAPPPNRATTQTAGDEATRDQHVPQAASPSASADVSEPDVARGRLTTVDRYYQAWLDYQRENGKEPTAAQLSTILAGLGLTGRGGSPISPSNLRRYLLEFRIYRTWFELGERNGSEPGARLLAQELTRLDITGQHNTRIGPERLQQMMSDFRRRRGALDLYDGQPDTP